MKKIFFLIIFMLFLTGCNSYNELNQLAIIKSIGIKYDKSYTLYSEIIDEVDKNNNPKTKIISTNGKDIDELFNNIKSIVNKKIHFSHIDLIILDENLNKNNLNDIINYFLNHNEFRNDFLTIISNDINKVLENSKYDEVENIIISNKESKNIIKISFEEIISKFLDNKDFILSKIIYKNEIEFDCNYKYINNKFERITNEKNRT